MRIATVTAVLTVALAAPALAHVDVERTTPRKGSTTSARVSVASVTFSGPLRKGSLRVTGPGGALSSVDAGGRDPRNVRRLVVELRSGLRAGVHRARWTVTGSDGHTQRGSFSFRVRR